MKVFFLLSFRSLPMSPGQRSDSIAQKMTFIDVHISSTFNFSLSPIPFNVIKILFRRCVLYHFIIIQEQG